MNNKLKRTHIIVPLIVVLMLISIIAVICVGAPFGRPSEIAELNRDVEPNTEQISAETTTLNGGEEYVIPEDGLYKIELHGGSSSRYSGSKVMEGVVLHSGDRLKAIKIPASEVRLNVKDPQYIDTKLMRSGESLELYINSSKRGFVSGASGVTQVYVDCRGSVDRWSH